MGEVALMIEQQGSDKIREWAKKTSLHGEKPLYAEFVLAACRMLDQNHNFVFETPGFVEPVNIPHRKRSLFSRL